jgi:hypothetical protein
MIDDLTVHIAQNTSSSIFAYLRSVEFISGVPSTSKQIHLAAEYKLKHTKKLIFGKESSHLVMSHCKFRNINIL